MLLRHSGIYLLARGIPAAVNLAAVALYTRLLSPGQYGQYALVFTGALVAGAVFFQWLRMGLVRFLPGFAERKDVLLSTLVGAYLAVLAMTALPGGLMVLFWPDPAMRGLIALGIGFFWLYGWFEINLEIARSQLAPLRYGLVFAVKSVLALTVGGFLAYYGMGPAGLLVGLIAGNLAPMPWLLKREWSGVRLSLVDRQVLRQLLAYGMPFTATFALTYVTSSSDRFLLAGLIGSDAAGLYTVANDFAKQSIWVLMETVNLAAFPLAVRALEKSGSDTAVDQMEKNGMLLLVIAVPAGAGIAALSGEISGLFFGPAFREAATDLIPLIILGTFFFGMRSFYFDQSFLLSKATVRQIWVVLAAASLNVSMNLLLIPAFGLKGAAYSNIASGAVGMALSWFFGRSQLRLRIPLGHLGKVLLATAGMVAVVLAMPSGHGAPGLAVRVALGALAYFALLAAMNRQAARTYFGKLVGYVNGTRAA